MPLPAFIRRRLPPDGPEWLEPRRGYRSGPENTLVTALLRTHPTPPGNAPRILDLGAGAGSLGLIVGQYYTRQGRRPHLIGVERDPELAAFCATNYAASPLDASAVEADLRTFSGPSADLVLCNPPFFAAGHGRPSTNPSVHGATHALHGGLESFLTCALNHLRPSGSILLLYPADQLAEVLALRPAIALELRALLLLHARHTGRPYRAWCLLQPPSRSPEALVVRIASTLTSR